MNRFFPWLGYLPMLDADDGTNPGGAGDDQSGEEEKPETLSLTQAELDKIIQKRVARAVKDADAKAKADAEKAKLDDTERLKAEKDEADQRAADAITTANQRIIRAEATACAVALDIKPERIKHALKLADLSEVTVGDDGEPDGKAIKAALEAVLKELPELKADAGASRSGGSFHGQNGHQGKNPWAKKTFNLTEQARILRENPGLATQLQQAAKG